MSSSNDLIGGSFGYLLRNNTFLTQKCNLTSTEQAILTFILIEAQKYLFKTYPIRNRTTIESMKKILEIDIKIEDLKSFCANRNLLRPGNINQLCRDLSDIPIEFTDYNGITHLSHLMEISYNKQDLTHITANIRREVYLFLYDYNLDLRQEDFKFIDDEEDFKQSDTIIDEVSVDLIPEEAELSLEAKKAKLQKGFTKIDFHIFNEIKNFYAMTFFMEFKVLIEQSLKYTQHSIVHKEYTLAEIREKCFLQNKLKDNKNLRIKVIDKTVSVLNDSNYLKLSYTQKFKKGIGGSRLDSVVFHIEPTEKFFKLNELKYSNIPLQEKTYTKGDSLSAKLRQEGRLNVGGKTLDDYISLYGERIVYVGVHALLAANETSRVRAPKKWLMKTLEDLKDKEILREQRTNSNNINPMSFNNIEGREYDYNDLEKKLLGWDS